jgi:hypothetical protein
VQKNRQLAVSAAPYKESGYNDVLTLPFTMHLELGKEGPFVGVSIEWRDTQSIPDDYLNAHQENDVVQIAQWRIIR